MTTDNREPGDGDEFEPVRVPIVYNPEVPKDQPALFMAVRNAAKGLYDSMTAYLVKGDVNSARRSANALLFYSAVRKKAPLALMMSAAINMRQPLTDEQRQQAKEELYSRGAADL